MNMQLGIPLNSLDDNKGTFFYIFYFFPLFFSFFFCSFTNRYLRHVRAGLGSNGKRISSRLDAITAEKEREESGEAERKHGNLIMRAALIKARVPICTKNSVFWRIMFPPFFPRRNNL